MVAAKPECSIAELREVKRKYLIYPDLFTVHTDDNDDDDDNDNDDKWTYLFVVFACTYCEVVHVVQKPRSRRHTNALL